jgi:hypothetical protein
MSVSQQATFFRSVTGNSLQKNGTQEPRVPRRHAIGHDGVRITYWTSRDIKPKDTPVVFLHRDPGYNSNSIRRTEGLLLEGDGRVDGRTQSQPARRLESRASLCRNR